MKSILPLVAGVFMLAAYIAPDWKASLLLFILGALFVGMYVGTKFPR